MKILVFAPHNDDEVLGVGGTIAKYSSLGHEVVVCEVTKSATAEKLNVIRSEALEAHKILGVKETIFLDFPVVRLKETPLIDLNKEFHRVVQEVKPDMAFIPHKGDMHMDHGIVSHSAMVAMRPINGLNIENIFVYETLSETEWNIPTVDNAYIPNVWSDISPYFKQKLEAMSSYKSQLNEAPHPRSNEIIESLAKFRGSTIGVPFAETFMLVRKIM
ncbi:PIG-L deacetylase family protein [Planococcus lenghuensis]|uniref:PIG-L domain-containing protein n=1 Tax=Planococcus lenghuensis TaxID=2213202 RepID=A0A1Q2L1A4_9BACL|nr:PIG-L deacetylase family protein [Planococcus lenghuensis]AQQ54211.1 PIG-L domain-containing protein [Planococcus lenghuensis]